MCLFWILIIFSIIIFILVNIFFFWLNYQYIAIPTIFIHKQFEIYITIFLEVGKKSKKTFHTFHKLGVEWKINHYYPQISLRNEFAWMSVSSPQFYKPKSEIAAYCRSTQFNMTYIITVRLMNTTLFVPMKYY